MRIFKLLIVFLLVSIIPVFAYEDRRTVQEMVTHDTLSTYSTMSVHSLSTITTDSQSLVNTGLATNIGIMYKATSSGTVALTLQALRSFKTPDTEDAPDATYVVWNVSTTTSDQAWHMATLDTVVEPYMRYQITGTGSNDASTTIQIKVEKL